MRQGEERGDLQQALSIAGGMVSCLPVIFSGCQGGERRKLGCCGMEEGERCPGGDGERASSSRSPAPPPATLNLLPPLSYRVTEKKLACFT